MPGKRKVRTLKTECEQPGHYTLPAARLTWWNLDKQSLESIDFPARTFEIAPNPALPSPPPKLTVTWLGLGHISKTMLIIILGAVVMLAFRMFSFWRNRRRLWETLRPTHLESLNPSVRE